MAVSPLAATVVDSSAHGFTVLQRVEVPLTPEEAFRTFTQDIGRWWNGSHTFSGEAGNLSLKTFSGGGGCLCESWEGGYVEHLRVVNVQYPNLLRLKGGLGPLQVMPVSGSMTLTFEAKGGGTEVSLVYAVGGYHPQGMGSMAAPVDGVLGEQMQQFAQFTQTDD